MPNTGSINQVSGIYRSDCCKVERAVPKDHKFPPCDGRKTGCGGNSANWTLVRETQTK
jgi:hypothetical protein